MQTALARYYGRADLAPVYRNKTPKPEGGITVSDTMMHELDKRYEKDRELISWIRLKFEKDYCNLGVTSRFDLSF